MSSQSPCDLSQAGWKLESSYAQLPEMLHSPATPAPARKPSLTLLNRRLAEEMGLRLDEVPESCLADVFTGQVLPPASRPLAQAYAGHQFGYFTMLGDGRALLIGEQRAPDGRLLDIQFKGSGRTPFSRQGDGLAALGPMLREYVISEAMHALGVPTTRSLAVATTGEPVYRNATLAGAVLTRVAASHLRVGTFQYVAARRDSESLRILADYAIVRHAPQLMDAPNRHLALFREVAERQAGLVAHWQSLGFIHGVMNTDNMAVSGETIDYGPCAFMDRYHPQTVFSSIDQDGRYAYANQPQIAKWNLARFAEALLPLLDTDPDRGVELALDVLESYSQRFAEEWLARMRGKLGLNTAAEDDEQLVLELLAWMEGREADFTNTFDALSTDALDQEAHQDPVFMAWRERWLRRLASEQQSPEQARMRMRNVNPAVIPRNERVEEALIAATQEGDLSVLRRLLDVLRTPFARSAGLEPYRQPPHPEAPPYRTFCGT